MISELTVALPVRLVGAVSGVYVHCIVPGGGISPTGDGLVSSRANFFLPVRVLSRLFRRLFLEGLIRLHEVGELAFFNDLAPLADIPVFRARLAPLRRTDW